MPVVCLKKHHSNSNTALHIQHSQIQTKIQAQIRSRDVTSSISSRVEANWIKWSIKERSLQGKCMAGWPSSTHTNCLEIAHSQSRTSDMVIISEPPIIYLGEEKMRTSERARDALQQKEVARKTCTIMSLLIARVSAWLQNSWNAEVYTAYCSWSNLNVWKYTMEIEMKHTC